MMEYLFMSIQILAVELAGIFAIVGAFYIYDKRTK